MNKRKRIISILLLMAVMLTSVMGCGSGDKKNTSKGRYIEEDYDLPEGLHYIIQMSTLDNGDIILVATTEEGSNKAYISKDGGKSWEDKEIDLPKGEFDGEIQIQSLAIDNNDKVYLQYMKYTKEQLEAMDKYNPDDENSVWDEEKMTPETKFVVSDGKGNFTDIKLEDEKIDYINNMKFSKDGDLFFDAYNSEGSETVYQLDKDSLKIKHKYKSSEYANGFCLLGKNLIIFSFDSATKYNTESGKKEGAIKELKKSCSYMEGICSDGEKTIYFKNDKGLNKYTLGDKKPKQIIDGSLSSFGDYNMYLEYLLKKDNDEFLAIFSDGNSGTMVLKNYKYDSKVASKPENQITVYSLYEDYTIQQAIVLYQKSHPDVYINYEAGITYDEEGKESVSESDAIKAINTKFMAGKGPDIILLDGLPAESYKKKDLLEDITDIINKNKDKFFSNITDAYTSDKKIYSYPLNFTVPVIVTKGMGNIEDFNALVNEVEKIGSGNGKIIEAFTPEEVVAMFYNSCEKSWINEDKTINEEKLKEFLDGIKKIYDINSKAITEEDKQAHEKEKKESLEYITEEQYLEYLYFRRSEGMYYMFKDSGPKIDLGTIYSHNELSIYEKIKEDKFNINNNTWAGQIGKYFMPQSEVAIAKKSDKKDVAKDFVEFLFSDEYQKTDANVCFPINKSIFENNLKNMDDDGGSYGFGGDENGEGMIEIQITKLSDEQISNFIKTVEELKVPYSSDKTIYDKISKELEDYVAGKSTMDKTIKAVKSNLEIYLSE